MASTHRPSPLRVSDSTWVTSRIIETPSSPPLDARPSSSLDLVPAPRASDLQIILRTRDQTAYYDPSSNELSLQKRIPASEGSEPGSTDAPLVPRRQSSQSLLQRFTGSLPPAGAGRRKNEPVICPTCARPWPIHSGGGLQEEEEEEGEFDNRFEEEAEDATPGLAYDRESPSYIAPNYFRLLAQASTTISSTPHHHHSSSSTSPNPSTSNFNSRPSTPPFLPRNRFSSASGTSTPATAGASTPPLPPHSNPPTNSESDSIPSTSSAQGYYSRFFIELHPLGRGARGQVFLCQHILNGNKLGKYAIKKIPVGDHASSLLQSLNEVHLMETLHHPHLIHYQHAWIERCRLGKFQPEVPTLFVLMMAANGGSLADWISARAGEKGGQGDSPRQSGGGVEAEEVRGKGKGKIASDGGGERERERERERENTGDRRKIERLKTALRQRRATRQTQHPLSSPNSNPPPPPSIPSITTTPTEGVGVHLLRTEEIYSLLSDIVSGLSFLHHRGILHLDIKPGNVLLHWDEDSLIPRALLSDFGSSLFLHDNWTRTRSGHTGTMEYMSPETIIPEKRTGKLKELSAKADIWSVGMILHLLLFFRLPYGQTEDVGLLRVEMERYRGFSRRIGVGGGAGGRGDDVLLGLLERMLNIDPGKRPSCEEILIILNQSSKAQPKQEGRDRRGGSSGPQARAGQISSLALYRPSALPLPTSSLADPHASHNTSLRQMVWSRQTWKILVALIKCLSPTILHFLSSDGQKGKGVVEMTFETIIILFALLDLSSSMTYSYHSRRGKSRSTSIWCWIAHFALLLLLVWYTS